MNLLPNSAPYEMALKFFEAAEILEQQSNDYSEIIIMQYAFSAELCLKSFFTDKVLYKEGKDTEDEKNELILNGSYAVKKNVYIHDLHCIYQKLLPNVKDVLDDFFKDETGCSLENLSKECAKYFEESRYFFSKNGVLNYSSVRILADGLIKAVRRFEKEFGENTRILKKPIKDNKK